MIPFNIPTIDFPFVRDNVPLQQALKFYGVAAPQKTYSLRVGEKIARNQLNLPKKWAGIHLDAQNIADGDANCLTDEEKETFGNSQFFPVYNDCIRKEVKWKDGFCLEHYFMRTRSYFI